MAAIASLAIPQGQRGAKAPATCAGDSRDCLLRKGAESAADETGAHP